MVYPERKLNRNNNLLINLNKAERCLKTTEASGDQIGVEPPSKISKGENTFKETRQ